MNGLYSLLIAVSMYSKFPVPTVNWTRERMGYVMCWFPVVGVIEGLALWFWQWAGGRLGFTDAGNALVAAALPLIVTGGIHMDGFLDTMDAIHSYGDREKKLEILKDPHVGAFAVIGCGGYLLLYAAAAYEVTVLGLWPLALPVFVMERAFSGLSVVFFPCAKKSGLVATFSDGAKRRAAGISLSLWLAAALCLGGAVIPGGSPVVVLGLLAVQLLVFAYYRRRSAGQFGGITGDLAGYFLQVCELAGLFWLAVAGHMGFAG